MNKITTKMKRHVKHELKYEGPTLWVGKDGLTPQVLVEVEKQLNRQRMIKIRILRTALQEETAQIIANRVAQQTKSALVEVRGARIHIIPKTKSYTCTKTSAKQRTKARKHKKQRQDRLLTHFNTPRKERLSSKAPKIRIQRIFILGLMILLQGKPKGIRNLDNSS